MTNTGSAEKTPAEVVLVTETAPAALASQKGPGGMPKDYVGREMKNPDDLTMKHAGALHIYSSSSPKLIAMHLDDCTKMCLLLKASAWQCS